MKWRNGRSAYDHFELEVKNVNIKISQRKHAEITGIGTGGNVWNAPIVLIKYLEKRIKNDPSFVQSMSNKRFIELGSGTGIIGLAYSLLFPDLKSFLMTDQKQVLPIIEENIKNNIDSIPKLNDILFVEELEWGSDVKRLEKYGPFDFIIACDCIAPIFPLDLLLKTLVDLSTDESTIILAYEHRQFTESFFDEAYRIFDFKRIPHDELDENYCDDDMDVYLLTKKKGN